MIYEKIIACVFCVFIVFVVVACGRKIQNGPVSAGLIPLTAAPTLTPDVNFTVYIHQESTPVKNVEVSLLSSDGADKAKSKTGDDGRACFKINRHGGWAASVDSFDGFKAQVFAVEHYRIRIGLRGFKRPGLTPEISYSRKSGLFRNGLTGTVAAVKDTALKKPRLRWLSGPC